ncbi:MAG: TlpA disulfide reductase family protein [Acidobacteriota bacterium]|nr:TlpA disulfide reductase family protein [Acidobacteriota bacterium]MDQ7088272.1 TlpA disulfide reductase family protein [Acidobacteriota bacterium]
MNEQSVARVVRGRPGAVVMVALLLALAGCGGGGAESHCRPTFVTAGEKAPEVTLVGLDGKPQPLHALIEGKVALVDLWATWCAPCVAAMPHLQELYEKYRDRGFVVVGVMSDSNATTLGADGFKDKGVSYPMLLDDGSEAMACAWGPVMGYPLVILVDPEGTVIETWSGTVGTERIAEKIESVLAAAGDPTGAETATPEGEAESAAPVSSR